MNGLKYFGSTVYVIWKVTCMLQVRATIKRGCLKRTFLEWCRLANDRRWKKQLLFRDREIELLERLCNGFRNRPIVVLRKRRMLRCLQLWLVRAVHLRRKRMRMRRAVEKFRNWEVSSAWTAWIDYVGVRSHPNLYTRPFRVCCFLAPQYNYMYR